MSYISSIQQIQTQRFDSKFRVKAATNSKQEKTKPTEKCKIQKNYIVHRAPQKPLTIHHLLIIRCMMQNASEKSDNKRKSNEHFHLIRFVLLLFQLFCFSSRLPTEDWLMMHRPIVQHTLKIMYKCISSNINRIWVFLSLCICVILFIYIFFFR